MDGDSLNGLTALTEEKLKKLLVESKRIGTSTEFIKLLEAAIQHKTSIK
jgi:hypothetical protein